MRAPRRQVKTPVDLRRELVVAGERLAKVRADEAAVLPELAETVAAAHAAHIPITEIARLTGLSRPTIYAWLRGPD